MGNGPSKPLFEDDNFSPSKPKDDPNYNFQMKEGPKTSPSPNNNIQKKKEEPTSPRLNDKPTTSNNREKVLRKCTKRYGERFTELSQPEKEKKIGDISNNVVDPYWISEEIFGKSGDTVTLKLLLIPVAPSAFANISKFIDSKYGYLHTALQINNRVVDWDLTGLVIPREFSSKVYTALDISSAEKSSSTIQKTPEFVEKVVQFIIKWNKEYEYGTLTKNCQHFVNELLGAIGIRLTWNESIANYIKEIRDNPENIKPHIDYIVEGKKTRKYFEDHEDLDNFIENIRNDDPDQYDKLKPLLKAFDRGFWFRDRCANPDGFKPPPMCPYSSPTGYPEIEFDRSLL